MQSSNQWIDSSIFRGYVPLGNETIDKRLNACQKNYHGPPVPDYPLLIKTVNSDDGVSVRWLWTANNVVAKEIFNQSKYFSFFPRSKQSTDARGS